MVQTHFRDLYKPASEALSQRIHLVDELQELLIGFNGDAILKLFRGFDKSLSKYQHPYFPDSGFLPILCTMKALGRNQAVEQYVTLYRMFRQWIDSRRISRLQANFIADLEYAAIYRFPKYLLNQNVLTFEHHSHLADCGISPLLGRGRSVNLPSLGIGDKQRVHA